MAASTQAASFVGAVLEQAGYLAQADFLRLLKDFFREAGAFVYILGAIGALISFVTFGSFRAARYLLLGPALYWFLVGPTFTFDGVVWRVGSGDYRGLNGRRGLEQAKANVKDILEKSGIKAPNGNIEVAYGFALFVRVINTVSSELVELIVNARDDEEYLRYVSKGLALDSAMRIQITNPALINMIEEDFFARCANAFAYSVAASAAELRPELISLVTSGGAQAAQARKTEYEGKAAKGLDDFAVTPSGSTRFYLQSKGITDNERIPCRRMWDTITGLLESDAKTPTENIITMAQGDKSNRAKACERVLQKITGKQDAGGGCEEKLQRAVAMMMLKNTVFDRRASSRFVKRIAATLGDSAIPKDIQDYLNNPNEISGNNNRLLGPALDRALLMSKQAENMMRGGVGLMSPGDAAAAIIGYSEMQIKTIGKNWSQEEIDKERNQAKSIAKASAMVGTMDAGLTEYPKYHLRNLRQQLFSWAINLPYWQGVLLYVLAAAYPFMALIVLLPGRAAGFMNLPMAWLWVKSWDIGLAFVMLFEKVLWNVLPSLKVSNQVLSSRLEGQPPWELFGEAQKFDQTWNLHIYYIALSMVTLSIPAVTGYATLRARRAVLSSFTQKLASDASDAGGLAAGNYGTNIMAERSKVQGDLQAHAMSLAGRLPTDPGYGNYSQPRLDKSGKPMLALDSNKQPIPVLDDKGQPVKGPDGSVVNQIQMTQGGERDIRSREYAVNAAVGALTAEGQLKIANIVRADWTADDFKTNLGALQFATNEIKAAVTAYQQEYTGQMKAWHELHQAELGAFHPIFGRWGTLGIANISYVAAVDGFGGYEIEPSDVTSVGALINLHKHQFESRMRIAGKLLEGLPPVIDSGGKTIPTFPFADAMDYIHNPNFKPNEETLVGRLMKASSFGDRENVFVPPWAGRTEGASWMTHEGMYNAEIASWKLRYEAGNKTKSDGSPISDDEYKQSIRFHEEQNKKTNFGPEGIFHKEVAPGQFKLDIPEKLIELMIPNIKLDGNYGVDGFMHSNIFSPPKEKKPSVFEPAKIEPAKPEAGAFRVNPARDEISKHYETVLGRDRERKEADRAPKTWHAAQRDMQQYESLFDLLEEDNEENKHRRQLGRRAFIRSNPRGTT